MRLLLLLELLLIVVSQLCRECLTLLILDMDLSQVNFEFFEEPVDSGGVLSFNLLDLSLISLPHLQTFLFKLQIAIAFLLQFLLE